MFLAIDMVQEVYGILDDTIADIAIVTAWLRCRRIFVYNDAFTEFTVQVDLVFSPFEVLSL